MDNKKYGLHMDQSKNYGALSGRKKRRRAKIFGKIKTTRVDEP